jgi:hypothetical protein
MKALIHETTRLFDKKRPQENRAWRDLVKFMKQCLNSINKLSVDWCLTMKFTGKDETDIGTAQWTSFHYVAFTRLSLYFFGYIDILLEREGIVEETKTGIKCFKKMILSFLVLVSYVFDPDFEPSCDVDQKIESYVRLFLTSCYHFDKNTRKESVRYDDDGEIVREERVSKSQRQIQMMVKRQRQQEVPSRRRPKRCRGRQRSQMCLSTYRNQIS